MPQKWLILGLDHRIYKMNLEHLVCARKLEVLKHNTQTATMTKPYIGGDMSKEWRSQLKALPMTKDRTSNKIK